MVKVKVRLRTRSSFSEQHVLWHDSIRVGVRVGVRVRVRARVRGGYFLRLHTPFSIVGVMYQPHSLG